MLKHISFGEGPKSLAILVPEKAFNAEEILHHYIYPLVAAGLNQEEIIVLNLDHDENGKAPVTKVIKPWLEQLEKILLSLNVKHVMIAEAGYFKTICKQRKAEPHYGYELKTIWPNITGFITTNYKALMFNPSVQQKIDLSIQAVAAAASGGVGLFHNKALKNVRYPKNNKEVAKILSELKQLPAISCDIEGYSLRVDKAKVATIAFGLDMETAVAFPINDNSERKYLLRNFFETYEGGKLFHQATYDIKVLIWELFMEHPTDYVGMLEGLEIMFNNLHDTKILAYLALNTTETISYGLKDLAFEHTGNYAVDIKDITKLPMKDVLEYNATDAIATWFVYNRYRSTVKAEQESVYQDVFRPTLKTLTYMELCGTPINMEAVLRAEKKMDHIRQTHTDAILADPQIHIFEDQLRDTEAAKATAKLKKLVKTRDDFKDLRFNPNSDSQVAALLYDFWGLPVLESTKGGNPSTKKSVLEGLLALIKRTPELQGQGITAILEHICELHDVSKILNTFIPAFKKNSIPKDDWHYLHGGYNLGGTKSGRLSSSDPNMQNIPSTGTQYAKLIKECFQPPPLHLSSNDEPGWIFVGADYSSLEDRVSALLTKDPNKLAVYVDGYDGHCLRAYSYFKERMPDITQELNAGHDAVVTINSIEKRYPDERQDSKGPTFLLTYMGTWKGLIRNFGFTESAAKDIESRYHEMYKVSDDWVMDQLEVASDTGYVELAFGLRLRTPLLQRVVFNSRSMPYQARKTMKTAGNALGQSYGLLNSHSANLFMERVKNSPYKYAVLPCMQVHDSQYYMIHNTLDCLKWVNDNLIECMEWNQLAPIQHPQVKLAATLELYHQSWAEKITIPNTLSKEELRTVIDEGLAQQKEARAA